MARTVLVTGASGFIAGHVCRRLLSNGDHVIAASRNCKDLSHIQNDECSGTLSTLEYASLTDKGLPTSSLSECDSIVHIASPMIFASDDPENEVIKPAVDATIGALKTAIEVSKKRGVVIPVVVLSSIAAISKTIAAEPGTEVDEGTWADGDNEALDPYSRSKVAISSPYSSNISSALTSSQIKAEQAAWDLYKEHKDEIALYCVNAGLVIGPQLTERIPPTNYFIKMMLDGTYPMGFPRFMPLIDVRDLALCLVKFAEGHELPSDRYFAGSPSHDVQEVVATVISSCSEIFGSNGLAESLKKTKDEKQEPCFPVKFSNKRLTSTLKVKLIDPVQSVVDGARSLRSFAPK